MKKFFKLKLFGAVPLVILIISAIYLLWVVATGNINLQKEHIAGLAFVTLTTVAFFILYKPFYKLAILVLGFTLLVGLCGFIALSPAIVTSSIYIGSFSISFQPGFLLWMFIHIILSGRYYVGVITRKYWEQIRSSTPLSINDDH